jgi:hypothetical protein
MTQASPPLAGFEGVDVTYDSAVFRLGEVVTLNGIMYRFVQVTVSGGLALGEFGFITNNLVAAKSLTAGVGTSAFGVCAAQTIILQNEFAWVAIAGTGFVGRVLANFAANSKVYTTTTPGVVDDTVTTIIGGGLRSITGIDAANLARFEAANAMFVQ